MLHMRVKEIHCTLIFPPTDLRQEMKIRNCEVPDNDKCLERVRSPIDSNKLKVEMETQTNVPGSPLKSKLNLAYRRTKSVSISLNCMKSPPT
jgi:hypothetical protein